MVVLVALTQETSTESIKSLRRRATVDPVWYHTMQIKASLPPKEYQQYFPQARKENAETVRSPITLSIGPLM